MNKGAQLRKILPQFQQFLNDICSHPQPLSEAAKNTKRIFEETLKNNLSIEKLEQIKKFCSEVEDQQNIIEKAIVQLKDGSTTPRNIEQTLKELGNKFYEKLKNSNDLLFPGGWSAKPMGHQILFRLTKNDDDSITFREYNTNGTNHETTFIKGGKVGFYAAWGFNIPPDYDETTLINWIGQLLRYQVVPMITADHEPVLDADAKKAGEETLSIIHTGCTLLNGTVLPGKELAKPITGQRANTCVTKALRQAMQVLFSLENDFDTGDYRQFLAMYRMYLLHKHMESEDFEKNIANIPHYSTLLKRSIANLTRMFDPNGKEDNPKLLIDSETLPLQTQSILKQIAMWKEKLASSVPQKKTYGRMALTAQEKTWDFSTNPNLTFTSIVELLNAAPLRYQGKEYVLTPKTTLQSALNTLVSQLKAVPSPNAITSNQWIEDMCLFFSQQNPLLLDKDDATKSKETLQQLTQILLHYKQTNPITTPRNLMVYLGLMHILDRLCEQGYYTHDGYPLTVVPLHAPLLLPLLQELEQNAFIQTQDDFFPKLLQNIKEFYQQFITKHPLSSNHEERATQYYNKLIQTVESTETIDRKKQWENSRFGFFKSSKTVEIVWLYASLR